MRSSKDNQAHDMAQIARRANEYAKEKISQSNTSLRNLEGLDRHDKKAVRAKIGEINAIRDQVEGIRDQVTFERGKVGLGDMVSSTHHAMITLAEKHRAGNCGEFSSFVVDYIARNHPDVLAEVVEIKNGNHVFAVIGRDENSDPARPETWGANAYIVDAWAGKFYKASEYMTELKALGRETKGITAGLGKAEDFDHSKHELFLYPYYNSRMLNQQIQKEDVFHEFTTKIGELVAVLRKQQESIQNEMRSLEGKKDKKAESRSQSLKQMLDDCKGVEKQLMFILKTENLNNDFGNVADVTKVSEILTRRLKSLEESVKEATAAKVTVTASYSPYARRHKDEVDRAGVLIQHLAKKLGEYDQEVKKLLDQSGKKQPDSAEITAARKLITDGAPKMFITSRQKKEYGETLKKVSAELELATASVMGQIRATAPQADAGQEKRVEPLIRFGKM